jgi:hypothetical protein
MLGEGLGVVVITLSHGFILRPLHFVLLPLLFISLPQSLLQLFDLHESERNFGSITPMFSNCMPDNGATKNNRVMTLKSHLDSWLVTNTTLCPPLRGYPKRDSSGPSHLICMTHMRHVGPKWVTHRFCYTTYVFNRTMQWFR